MPITRATDGIELYYETWGDPEGEPVLLVMGLGADMRGWIMQRLAFGRRHFCVTFDNRGVGRSETSAGPYSLEQMAQDAVSVLDAAGVESAHVVGASMGGVIAQILSVGFPDRVRSLTLACTSCRHHQWRRELLEEWEETARERGMGALAPEAFRWLINPRIRRRFGLWLNILARVLITSPDEGFANQARAILDFPDEMRDELHQVTVPTLVIVGSQDILTPKGDSVELCEMIPHAELVVIGGAAHGVNVEAPAKFNDAVLDFLSRVSAEPAHERGQAPTPYARADLEAS